MPDEEGSEGFAAFTAALDQPCVLWRSEGKVHLTGRCYVAGGSHGLSQFVGSFGDFRDDDWCATCSAPAATLARTRARLAASPPAANWAYMALLPNAACSVVLAVVQACEVLADVAPAASASGIWSVAAVPAPVAEIFAGFDHVPPFLCWEAGGLALANDDRAVIVQLAAKLWEAAEYGDVLVNLADAVVAARALL